MRSLIIGERMNSRSKAGWYSMSKSFERWTQFSRSAGAFNNIRSQRRLRMIGVEFDEGMYLLPPSPKGPWDCELAENVAACVIANVAEHYDIIYLAGRRVTEAFCFPGEFGDAMVWTEHKWDYLLDRSPLFVSVPYPRCRNERWVKIGVEHARSRGACSARSST